MADTSAAGLHVTPGVHFLPTDAELVVHYLLPRLHGHPLPGEGIILDSDPYAAAPPDLLALHGKRDEAFFLAAKRPRARRAGGGTWKIQKGTGDAVVTDDGEVIAWRKELLLYHPDGDRKSSGWVMHQFEVTGDGGGQDLVLCRIKKSEQLKKRKKLEEAEAADADLGMSVSPKRPRTEVVEEATAGADLGVALDARPDVAAILSG